MTKSFKQVRTIIKVWDKAKKISGYDPDMWRQDFAGAWIRRDAYGTHTQYGWEIIESHETNLKISQQNKDLSLIETKHLYNEQLQQFENKFNRLLILYQEAISCYNDSPLVKNNKAHFEEKITNYLINASSPPISKPYRNRITEASKTFEVFLQLHRQQVSNHMRLLFQILYLLECEDIKSKDRIYYAKVFRSQLTDKELILIRYNCLSNRGEKMRLPVFHFNILKFLPLMDLLEFSEYRKYLTPHQINILNDELIGIRKKKYSIFNNNYYGRKKNNKWEYMPNYELSVSISKDNQSYIFALKKQETTRMAEMKLWLIFLIAYQRNYLFHS